MHDLQQRIVRVLAAERGTTGETFVEDRPQRVDIRRRADRASLLADLLGGDVAWRADDRRRGEQRRAGIERLAKPKSAILAMSDPLLANKIFAGFKSRCTTPRSWAK
jgi:hypothetical protein